MRYITTALLLCFLNTFAYSQDCGNAPLICAPLSTMYNKNSLDSKELDILYEKLIDASGNDRARLFNSSLATAVNEIRSGASDKSVKFWVLVLNSSKKPHKLNLYLSMSNNKTVANLSDDINCVLRVDKCQGRALNPFAMPQDEYKKIVYEQKDGGDIVHETNVEVSPNSWKAVGIGFPDTKGGKWRSLILLGGKAKGRVKMDENDILRVSFVKR